MDWLRSEDLKEEKVVTTSGITIRAKEWFIVTRLTFKRPGPGQSSVGG
jgi:hypothetical protein